MHVIIMILHETYPISATVNTEIESIANTIPVGGLKIALCIVHLESVWNKELQSFSKTDLGIHINGVYFTVNAEAQQQQERNTIG